MRVQNREKTQKELTRRRDEVLRRSTAGLQSDKDAEQFITLLAHYVKYVKDSKLTQKAIKRLNDQQDHDVNDKKLVAEAEKIIEELKASRDRLTRYARRRNINTGPYKFDTSGRVQEITGAQEVAFHLTFLNEFLDKHSDEQYVSEIPDQIKRLRSIIFALNQLTSPTRTIGQIEDQYKNVATRFEHKLREQGVLLDYLRIQDYRELDVLWQQVYKRGTDDNLTLFQLMYGHLFERNRTYSSDQQQDADEFVSTYVNYLERVHNYLTDRLEDVPALEVLWQWVIQHFAPTLVSFILLVLISLALGALGIQLGIDGLRTLLGL